MSNHHKRQTFGIHPYKIIVYLLIFGITALFLSLTIAYVYTRVQNGLELIQLPPIFLLNTALLLTTSFLLVRAKRHYLDDNTEKYKSALLVTIIVTLIFLLSQIYGWRQLLNQNVGIGSGIGTAYLYLISGLHFLHVLVGLPFLIMFYRTAVTQMVEPVSVLLYFSDPEKKVKLELLGTYWHFLDGLWIYLVMFFAVNYLL